MFFTTCLLSILCWCDSCSTAVFNKMFMIMLVWLQDRTQWILKFEEIIYKNRKTLLKMNPQLPLVWLIFPGLQTIKPFLETLIKIKLYGCCCKLNFSFHAKHDNLSPSAASWSLLASSTKLSLFDGTSTVWLKSGSHISDVNVFMCIKSECGNKRRSCFAFYSSELLRLQP